MPVLAEIFRQETAFSILSDRVDIMLKNWRDGCSCRGWYDRYGEGAALRMKWRVNCN